MITANDSKLTEIFRYQANPPKGLNILNEIQKQVLDARMKCKDRANGDDNWTDWDEYKDWDRHDNNHD